MPKKTLRVVVCNPGEPPSARDVPATMEAFQQLVGGPFELVALRGTVPALNGYDILVNEDATGLPFNRIVGDERIFGPMVVSIHDIEGKAMSLTAREIAHIVAALGGRTEASTTARGPKCRLCGVSLPLTVNDGSQASGGEDLFCSIEHGYQWAVRKLRAPKRKRGDS